MRYTRTLDRVRVPNTPHCPLITAFTPARSFLNCNNNNPFNITVPRPTVHMLAAASGNIISSLVFVPKDMIKQQIQVCANAAELCLDILPFSDPTLKTSQPPPITYHQLWHWDMPTGTPDGVFVATVHAGVC
jgi:hypothetical protein